MSCNGCRVLRKGCSDACILRPCLQWIESPQAQAHATVFVAKFFGRAGLMAFINAVPESERAYLFQSLLYEACGRTVNPVYGAVGLLSSGKWSVCQAAVETVLRGGCLKPETVSSTSKKQRSGTRAPPPCSQATQECSNTMATTFVTPLPSAKRLAVRDTLFIPLCLAGPASCSPLLHNKTKLSEESDQSLHLDHIHGSIVNPSILSSVKECDPVASKLITPIPRRLKPVPRSLLILQHDQQELRQEKQQEAIFHSDGIELDLTLSSYCSLGGIKLNHQSTRAGSPSANSEGSVMSFERSCRIPSSTAPEPSAGMDVALKSPQ